MPRASHRGTCTSRWYTGKRGFKAKERGLRRCEGYMYRGKGSAKPDRTLGSLKSAPFSRRLSTLVTVAIQQIHLPDDRDLTANSPTRWSWPYSKLTYLDDYTQAHLFRWSYSQIESSRQFLHTTSFGLASRINRQKGRLNQVHIVSTHCMSWKDQSIVWSKDTKRRSQKTEASICSLMLYYCRNIRK